jgi:hypothetical protein
MRWLWEHDGGIATIGYEEDAAPFLRNAKLLSLENLEFHPVS